MVDALDKLLLDELDKAHINVVVALNELSQALVYWHDNYPSLFGRELSQMSALDKLMITRDLLKILGKEPEKC